MTLVRVGQTLVGTTVEGEVSKIHTVSTISRLQGGDTKAWLHYWEPVDRVPEGKTTLVTYRFAEGEIVPPWVLFDGYDPFAMIERAAAALEPFGTPQEATLAVVRAMIRGPQQ